MSNIPPVKFGLVVASSQSFIIEFGITKDLAFSAPRLVLVDVPEALDGHLVRRDILIAHQQY